MTSVNIPAFLLQLEESFTEAMVSNDADRIDRCISEDWILVTPERGPIGRAAILHAIRSRTLTHTTMSKQPSHFQVLGEVAWITGRGQNTGTFRGEPIAADEYVTDVYHRRDGVWRCVLTHLTPAAK